MRSWWSIGMKLILPLTPALNWLWHLKRCMRQDVCSGFPLERHSFAPLFLSSRGPLRPPCFIDRCCCWSCVSFTSNLTFSPMIRTGSRKSDRWWWNWRANIHRNTNLIWQFKIWIQTTIVSQGYKPNCKIKSCFISFCSLNYILFYEIKQWWVTFHNGKKTRLSIAHRNTARLV